MKINKTNIRFIIIIIAQFIGLIIITKIAYDFGHKVNKYINAPYTCIEKDNHTFICNKPPI